jgi:Cu-Zn family superoxide dismutase
MHGEGHDPAQRTGAATIAETALFDGRGIRVAKAAASQQGDGIKIRLEASGLPAGVYGAHLHAVGRCDVPDFSSAGPHWNPGGRMHGRNNPQGMHLGDLPNLMIGPDGRGTLEISVAGASLSGRAPALLDQDGAAIVIHERPDDYSTDPSGNSGARIACGIFR